LEDSNSVKIRYSLRPKT